MTVTELQRAWAPRMLAVLRAMTALLFMQHGLQKLFGFPPSERLQPELLSLLGIGGVLEFVGGILVLIGLFTRPVAFLLAGMMAVAYFIVHAPQGFYPILNGGELAIMYCFIFLYLVLGGPGAWSIDGAIRRRR